MTKQTNGWHDAAVRDRQHARATRQARARLASKLKAERVPGSEYTPSELESLRDERIADTKARHPEWFR